MSSASESERKDSTASRIDAFKHGEGVIYRAKLIGIQEVDELHGKLACENAMMRLKLEIQNQPNNPPQNVNSNSSLSKPRRGQHKTKVNLVLRWDALYVHLSEGGRELLHKLSLNSISFVWKDPCDPRAFGLVCLSNDGNQPKFYGYKTEKLAMPCILSLKELFNLKSDSKSTNSIDKPKEETTPEISVTENASDANKTTEENKSSQDDLLNLDLEIDKTTNIFDDLNVSEEVNNVPMNNWIQKQPVMLNYSNIQSTGFPVQNIMYPINTNSPNSQIVSPSSQLSAPALQLSAANLYLPNSNSLSNTVSWDKHSNGTLSMQSSPWVANNNNNTNYNPFANQKMNMMQQPNTNVVSMSTSTYSIMGQQTVKSNSNPTNLFNDLVPSDFVSESKRIDPNQRPTKEDFVQKLQGDPKKMSLQEIKKQQQQETSLLDFNIFDTTGSQMPTEPSHSTATVNNINNNNNSGPQFFFD